MMERLFCDLHIHSCLSPCGDALMTPNNIAGMAFIKGLDVIAVCDHNSARNLPAVKAAADRMNVLLLPGMELTTREEAHMLCYFRTVQACMAFGEAIYAHLAPTPNNERFFGRQQVMNERDEEIDVEERLLIGALDLPFEACAARIREAGGLCVPAHINRGSSGVLGALGFLPQGAQPLANALVSFVCALQVQTFHKVRGHSYASTMCIGNLRRATVSLCAYCRTRDRRILTKALTYFGVILIFGIGAGLGSIVTAALGYRAVWICCALLSVSFVMMFVPEKK